MTKEPLPLESAPRMLASPATVLVFVNVTASARSDKKVRLVRAKTKNATAENRCATVITSIVSHDPNTTYLLGRAAGSATSQNRSGPPQASSRPLRERQKL